MKHPIPINLIVEPELYMKVIVENGVSSFDSFRVQFTSVERKLPIEGNPEIVSEDPILLLH